MHRHRMDALHILRLLQYNVFNVVMAYLYLGNKHVFVSDIFDDFFLFVIFFTGTNTPMASLLIG